MNLNNIQAQTALLSFQTLGPLQFDKLTTFQNPESRTGKIEHFIKLNVGGGAAVQGGGRQAVPPQRLPRRDTSFQSEHCAGEG